jgi:hypothetical protein
MQLEPTIIVPTRELDNHDRFCTYCNKPLRTRAALLELNQTTGEYCNPRELSAEDSQGGVYFGIDCARNLLNRRRPTERE